MYGILWYIYLHLVDFMVNVGKYSMHGAFGICLKNCYFLLCCFLFPVVKSIKFEMASKHNR